nr:uncharacterized protein LOC117281612 [Nicotiana tomentosiformis]
MGWYRSVTQFFVGNPIYRAGGRYVPYVGRHEALVIGLHMFHQLGLQMQQHTGERAAALHEYGRQVTDLASRTLRRARDDERLGYEAEYVAPEQFHRGPLVGRERGRRGRRAPRGRGVPRGRGGRRGGGPQRGGVEAPVEDVGVDQPGDLHEPDHSHNNMPSFSLQLQLTPGTSQVTLSAPLLITGTGITREDWDKYFPDLPGPRPLLMIGRHEMWIVGAD